MLDKHENCSTPGGSVSDLEGLFYLVAHGLERRGLIPDCLMGIIPGSGGWPCVPLSAVHCGRIRDERSRWCCSLGWVSDVSPEERKLNK